jgi:hypothetical protein
MQLLWLLLLWHGTIHLASGVEANAAKKERTRSAPGLGTESSSRAENEPPIPTEEEAEPIPSPPRRRQDLHSFLLYPEDFETDPDVNYLASKLHEPAIVAHFYASAAAIYADLEVWWRELSEDRNKAEKFLQYVRALAIAGAEEPLTVTNLVFAFGKHFAPLFTHRSKPLDSIAAMLAEIEQDAPENITDPLNSPSGASKSRLGVMTYFFHSFTLREIPQFEQFIWLMSRADMLPLSTTATGSFDMARTALPAHHNRVRTILANGIAKIGLLLKLFLDEGTDGVMDRSIRLVRRLWDLHLRRLLGQEKALSDGDENAIRYWTDPRHYRKTPINFTFADWDPVVAAHKAQQSRLHQKSSTAAAQASATPAGKPLRPGYNYWTSLILIIVLLGLFSGAVCIAISWYRQRRTHRFNQGARHADREEVYQL